MSDTVMVELSPYKLVRASSKLRWLRDTDDLEPTMRLQQAWEVVEYDKNDRARVVEIEWRDVPIVDEQARTHAG